MARCGCNKACSCVVEAGEGILVTGNGSAANPYVVSTDESEDCCPTVEGGDGIIVTETLGPDGQPVFTVASDPAQDCCPTVVSSDGSAVITQTLENGQPQYDVSVVPGADQTVIVPQDTPCIDMTAVQGPPGTWTVSAAPVIAPEPNGLECGPNGLTVPPSADAGNTLTVGTDGRLFTPASPVTVGCGLVIEPDGDIAIAGGTLEAANPGWTPAATDAVLCAADGTLHAPPKPPPTKIVFLAQGGITETGVNGPGILCGPVALISYTNTTCLPQIVTIEIDGGSNDIHVDSPNSVANGRSNFDALINALPPNPPTQGPASQFQVSNAIPGTGPNVFLNVASGRRNTHQFSFTLAPGDTLNGSYQNCVQVQQGTGGGSINSASIHLTAIQA